MRIISLIENENGDYIKILPIPDKTIINGLTIESDKLETDTQTGVATCSIIAGQNEYPLPNGLMAMDIKKVSLSK